jgi:hypothetical protein
VPTYGSVVYRNLYPGIDLRYKGTEGVLKREFVVAPRADPAAIRLHYEGTDAMKVDDAGALVLTTGAGTLTETPVTCYQEIDGRRTIIPAAFRTAGERDIAFSVGAYDPSFPLVIDPTLIYSTYLGGSSSETASAIALDGSGNTYVTGYTYSSDFPTTGSAYDTTYSNIADVFVTKLNPAGSALVYSTFLGGSDEETGYGIAIDRSGNAYVTGHTFSHFFPTTVGAYDRTFGGGSYDTFVTKLNPAGTTLVYSTFLGGANEDQASGIALDKSGNAYITGHTYSSAFPTTAGAYDRTYASAMDVFVSKLAIMPVTQVGVFRPSTHIFYLKNGTKTTSQTWGISTDIPVTGDWNADGTTEVGVFRPSVHKFYLRPGNYPATPTITINWGTSTDLPVTGKWS